MIIVRWMNFNSTRVITGGTIRISFLQLKAVMHRTLMIHIHDWSILKHLFRGFMKQGYELTLMSSTTTCMNSNIPSLKSLDIKSSSFLSARESAFCPWNGNKPKKNNNKTHQFLNISQKYGIDLNPLGLMRWISPRLWTWMCWNYRVSNKSSFVFRTFFAVMFASSGWRIPMGHNKDALRPWLVRSRS